MWSGRGFPKHAHNLPFQLGAAMAQISKRGLVPLPKRKDPTLCGAIFVRVASVSTILDRSASPLAPCSVGALLSLSNPVLFQATFSSSARKSPLCTSTSTQHKLQILTDTTNTQTEYTIATSTLKLVSNDGTGAEKHHCQLF